MHTLEEALQYVEVYRSIAGGLPYTIVCNKEEFSALCRELGKDNLRGNGWPMFVTPYGPVYFKYDPLLDKVED